VAHPNKDIAAALENAKTKGWRIEPGGSHAWGKMYCPYNDPDCRGGEFCIQSVWSTPKSAGNHAKKIRRIVDNCIIRKREEEDNKEQPSVASKSTSRNRP